MNDDLNVLRGLPHGVFLVDVDEVIRGWNATLEDWTGIAPPDAVGRSVGECLPDLATDGYYRALRRVLDEGTPTSLESDATFSALPVAGNGGEVPVYTIRLTRVQVDDRPWVMHSVEDVREVAEQTERIANLVKEASAAHRAKSDFVASMSHEIRTPLNGVLGFCDLLMEGELDPLQREFTESIRASGSTLLDLLNDILDFSRLEAGKVPLDPQPTDLIDVAKAVMELHRPDARRRQLHFEADLDTSIHGLWRLDVRCVKQVLLHLLENAVKFTEEGHVTLRMSVEANRITIEVDDTGVGIRPEDRAHLFRPFVQAESGATRRYGGSGLGLTVTHQLVELMGGTIEIESEFGKGTLVRVVLPAEPIDSEREKARRDERRASDRALLRGVHVLLVEDNPVNTALTRRVLEKTGAEVESVADGAQGVQAACAREFDVILMDCHMPVMDGWEATTRLRDNEVDTPIIALTADATEDDRGRCLQAGMDDYLSKPFKPKDLRRLVAHWGRRDRDENCRPSSRVTSRA